MRRNASIVQIAILALGFHFATTARAETKLERGKYLTTIMDCGGCHTTGSFLGKPDPAKYLAGSEVGWAIPTLGVFYPSNITADEETGIGKWTTKDIVKLLRTGLTPEGREVAPMMPWRSYAKASEADLEALAAFIKTVPGVKHAVPGPTKLSDVRTSYITIADPPK